MIELIRLIIELIRLILFLIDKSSYDCYYYKQITIPVTCYQSRTNIINQRNKKINRKTSWIIAIISFIKRRPRYNRRRNNKEQTNL